MERTEKNSVSPILIVAIVLLASIAGVIDLSKISAISSSLRDALGVKQPQIGLLMSFFNLAGVILALPGGIIVDRVGTFKSMLGALIITAAGSAVGGCCSSYNALLVSRVIEGCGLAFISIAAPSAIAMTIPRKKMGLAMGVYSTYHAVGQILIYNIGPRLMKAYNWQMVWWFTALLAVIAAVAWILLMSKMKMFGKQAEAEILADMENVPSRARHSFTFSVFKNKFIWLLMGAMLFQMGGYLSQQMFMPSYLADERGMTMVAASSVSSIGSVVGVVFSIITGHLLDKIRAKRTLTAVAMICCGCIGLLLLVLPTQYVALYFILCGAISPIVPVYILSVVSQVVESPSQTGTAMGLVAAFGQSAGTFFGPTIFSSVTQYFGWTNAIMSVIPIGLIGAVLLLIVRPSKKANSKEVASA